MLRISLQYSAETQQGLSGGRFAGLADNRGGYPTTFGNMRLRTFRLLLH